MPLSSWITSLFQSLLFSLPNAPTLLSPYQSYCLFEKIISDSQTGKKLLQPKETAKSLQSAYTLLKSWRCDITETEKPVHDWLDDFEKLCQKNDYLDQANLIDYLILHQDQLTLPKKIIFYELSDVTPAEKNLLDIIKKYCLCEEHVSKQNSPTIQAHTCDTQEDEWLTMARFAKAEWQKYPTHSLACIIPDLKKHQNRIAQIFSSVFVGFPAPYFISAGKPLSHFPLIRAAFSLLSLHKTCLAPAEFEAILTSSFAEHATQERIPRAKYAAYLAKNNVYFIEPKMLLTDLQTHCPLFAKQCTAFFDYLSRLKKELSHTTWAKEIMILLTLLGWPGDLTHSSPETENVLAQFAETIETITERDQLVIAQDETLTLFLARLQDACERALFKPNQKKTPIQILGPDEAENVPFDVIWMTSADDTALPSPAAPHALLPSNLQATYKMPLATADLSLKQAECFLQNLSRASSKLIFSYATIKDASEVSVSPLISVHVSKNKLPLSDYQSEENLQFNSIPLTYFTDEQGSPLQNENNTYGGTDIIKKQALCPFKAYAEWRLHTRDLETATPGLRALDKGNITHAVLETIWKKLKTQKNLMSLSEMELTDLIHQEMDRALSQYKTKQAHLPTYLNLEKERLFQLIQTWLAHEKSRPDFSVVATEKETEIKFNKLVLTVRIDRIDETHAGKKLLIDYKTNATYSEKAWLSDRPDEPQLPIYALIQPDDTIAISFATLNKNKYSFIGMSAESTDILGIKKIDEVKELRENNINWQNQLTSWRRTFEQLATDFCLGVATLSPKRGEETCDMCSLKSLCRVYEVNLNETWDGQEHV